MMKNDLTNVICVPFAYKSNTKSGENIFVSGNRRLLTYLKNACVALVSAKHYNRDAYVVLATNLTKQNIPDEIQNVLEENNIEIMNIPYDEFCFPDEYIWSLAFYKLCVLKHLCDIGFEKVLYLDTDVFVQGNLTSVWKEIEDKILLYDINHGLEVEDYRILCNEVQNFKDGGGNILVYHTLWWRIFCVKLQKCSTFY